MGISGIHVWELLLILIVVLVVFGSKRLPGIGSDFGAAIRGFRESFSKDDAPAGPSAAASVQPGAGQDTAPPRTAPQAQTVAVEPPRDRQA